MMDNDSLVLFDFKVSMDDVKEAVENKELIKNIDII